MKGQLTPRGADPRQDLDAEALREASLCAAPQVGRAARSPDMGMVAGGIGALTLGAVTLLALSSGGHAQTQSPEPAKAAAAASTKTPATPAVAQPASNAAAAPLVDPNQARSGPLIVDNTEGASSGAAKPATAPPPGPAGPNQPSPVLTADEQFSARIGGAEATAHAQHIDDPSSTVVQGSIIPAVLETALNSDLPGYARAIVSRDVKSFDGEKVAIPRGSRLIGQYKSGLSSGTSRALIIWTRLIRPDGVSIQLGSPVMDEAGETGLGGKVDRHFLQRFGGAMLLTVVGALPSALAGGSSTALVINSGSSGDGGAAQALAADARIAPTIRVPIGAPIQVFVARDLDFSGR